MEGGFYFSAFNYEKQKINCKRRRGRTPGRPAKIKLITQDVGANDCAPKNKLVEHNVGPGLAPPEYSEEWIVKRE